MCPVAKRQIRHAFWALRNYGAALRPRYYFWRGYLVAYYFIGIIYVVMEPIWQCKSFNELSVLELHTILRLRMDVFILEQQCIYPDIDGKDLLSRHLWASVDGVLVAYARIVPPGLSFPQPSIGRVLSHPEHRQYGHGKALMRHSIEHVEKQYGPTEIQIAAQAYLEPFYNGFGFRTVSEPYLDDGIWHVNMLRPIIPLLDEGPGR